MVPGRVPRVLSGRYRFVSFYVWAAKRALQYYALHSDTCMTDNRWPEI